ncbi:hypothetical protein M5D96_000888 [Drosophila gunungcola]|uniref:Uncharacterized protein n=1 Tax=Drosophila gunungcola TaxID=103775 RepID=A0A9Q0BU18_9MUSC|nr:hypothetical protein M5D96_000888 [Drosophila gunungcola]
MSQRHNEIYYVLLQLLRQQQRQRQQQQQQQQQQQHQHQQQQLLLCKAVWVKLSDRRQLCAQRQSVASRSLKRTQHSAEVVLVVVLCSGFGGSDQATPSSLKTEDSHHHQHHHHHRHQKPQQSYSRVTCSAPWMLLEGWKCRRIRLTRLVDRRASSGDEPLFCQRNSNSNSNKNKIAYQVELLSVNKTNEKYMLKPI